MLKFLSHMSIVNAPASTQQMGILTRKIIVIVLMQALDYNSSFSRRFLLFYKIHSTTIVFFFSVCFSGICIGGVVTDATRPTSCMGRAVAIMDVTVLFIAVLVWDNTHSHLIFSCVSCGSQNTDAQTHIQK